jgi:hypothetical protein
VEQARTFIEVPGRMWILGNSQEEFQNYAKWRRTMLLTDTYGSHECTTTTAATREESSPFA